MLKYIVKIGWCCEFEFDSIDDAGSFAVQAKTHRTENSDKGAISIKIIDDSEEVDDD